jgi:hypothetical protein
MFEPKYIKTKDNQIIIFPAKFKHSEFKYLEPVSAGFIAIGAEGKHNPDITCYGHSTSLDLKSAEEDTELAKKQFINYHY